MTVKEKTALISTILNVALTVLKFIVFFFTGSLAILAEAWHSFSDITTSVLVFISVREKRASPAAPEEGEDESKSIPLEYQISFLIGLLMFFVSVLLIWKTITVKAPVIENSLLSGIVFIIFAVASYIVYRFETSVGQKENSVGLIADGMHSRADMVNSLLIGFSLIIYRMGVNIDTLVALIIALFILSFSIETMVNAVMAYKRKKEEYVFRYKTTTIVLALFEKRTWGVVLKYLEEKLGSRIASSALLKKVLRYFCAVVILILGSICASKCVYTIGPSQEGIIERFGKPVNYKEPVQSGIHFKFPWPVDNVIKIDSKTIRMKNIGNITDKSAFALLWTKKHGTETAFISGDNNFFYPYLVIHYRIKDVFKYRYNHIDPEIVLDSAASQVVTNIFSKKAFYEIVTSYRKQFESDTVRFIQNKLDTLNSGLEVININMKDVHPPIFISSSFEEVIAAYQQKEEMINKAMGYKNESMPRARGTGAKLLKQAQSYVIDKTKRANGEASRFIMQLEGYQKSRGIITRKIYFDFVKEALSKNQKIIVDPSSGLPEIWLDSKQLLKSSKIGLD
jgi:membrane protease subunit HflK